jgi:hypothetical protein
MNYREIEKRLNALEDVTFSAHLESVVIKKHGSRYLVTENFFRKTPAKGVFRYCPNRYEIDDYRHYKRPDGFDCPVIHLFRTGECCPNTPIEQRLAARRAVKAAEKAVSEYKKGDPKQ